MGIYEYQCGRGHVSDLMVRHEQRPHEIDCTHPGCKEKAKFVVSATPTTFRANDRRAFKRSRE